MNQIRPSHNKRSLTERKQPNRRFSLLSKLQAYEYCNSKRTSSFATTQDFFENNYESFRPAGLSHPDIALHPPKIKSDKYREQTVSVQPTIESPDKDQLKHAFIRQAFQLVQQETHKNMALLKAKSVTPSIRTHKIRLVSSVANTEPRKLQTNQTVSFVDQPIELVPIKEKFKIRSHKIRRIQHSRKDEHQQTITGWGQPQCLWETEIQVL